MIYFYFFNKIGECHRSSVVYIRVSQPHHCRHFGWDNSLLPGCPVPCRRFSHIAGLYPLDASGALFPQVVTTKSISRCCQMFHERQNCHQWRTTDLEETELFGCHQKTLNNNNKKIGHNCRLCSQMLWENERVRDIPLHWLMLLHDLPSHHHDKNPEEDARWPLDHPLPSNLVSCAWSWWGDKCGPPS